MKQIATINLIIFRSTIFSNNMQQNTNEIQNKTCIHVIHTIYIQSSEETFVQTWKSLLKFHFGINYIP